MKRGSSDAKKNEYLKKVENSALLGEVISYTPERGKAYTQKEVIMALEKADLEGELARDLTVEAAFARACRVMQETRMINLLREDKSWLVFQLNVRQMDGDELKFPKETTLSINNVTGKIKCKVQALQELFTKKFEECKTMRTSSDITSIVKRLFDKECEGGGLFPIRDQGGAYFVPLEYQPFVLKVDEFLTALGGRVNRLPVAKGTAYGDEAVGDVVARGMEERIEKLKIAIAKFGIDTRPTSLENAADKINEAKQQAKAWAHYLRQHAGEVDEHLDDLDKELTKKVADLTKQRKEEEETPKPKLDKSKKDAFGAVVGSKTNKVNMALSPTEPRSMEKIMEVAGVGCTFYNHLRFLMKEGHALRTKDGYLLKKGHKP